MKRICCRTCGKKTCLKHEREEHERFVAAAKRASDAAAADHEPTEEELEAIIAEQSQRLPKWWDEAEKRGRLAVEEMPSVLLRGVVEVVSIRD